jgi:hypothetical protein
MRTFRLNLLLFIFSLSLMLLVILTPGSLAQSSYNHDLACRQYADAQATPYRASNMAAYAQQYYNSYYWNCMQSRQSAHTQRANNQPFGAKSRTDSVCLMKFMDIRALAQRGDPDGIFCTAFTHAVWYLSTGNSRAERLEDKRLALTYRSRAEKLGYKYEGYQFLGRDFDSRIREGDAKLAGIYTRRYFYHSNPRPISPPSGGFAPAPGPGCGPPFC